jgi:hypothetical protein
MRKFDSKFENVFYFSNKYVIHILPKVVKSKVWQHVSSCIFIWFSKTKRHSIGKHPNELSLVKTMFVSLLDQKLFIYFGRPPQSPHFSPLLPTFGETTSGEWMYLLQFWFDSNDQNVIRRVKFGRIFRLFKSFVYLSAIKSY